MNGLLWLIGVIVLIAGIVQLVQAQVVLGIVLILVGLLLMGYLGFDRRIP